MSNNKSTSSITSTTASLPSIAKNYSILSIPAAYFLAFPPYIYQFARGMTASGYTATNILPRTNLEILREKLPVATWQSLVRARGAHMNGLEGFPLFAAAMLTANLPQAQSRISRSELNFCAAEYLVARVLYTGLYMTVKSETASYLRSAVYFWSIGIPCYVLWKCAAGGNVDDDKGGNVEKRPRSDL